MEKNQKPQTTVYLTPFQFEWIKKQSRDFSFSKLIRLLLGDFLKLSKEDQDKYSRK